MGNNALSMTFYRNVFAIPILYSLVRMQKIEMKITKYSFTQLILIAVFGTTLTTVLLYSSYRYISVGTSTTIHFMYPVFVAVVLRFIFKDKFSKSRVISLIVASAGVFFFSDLKSASNMTGIVMSVFSGITYAFYMVWMEKKKLVLQNPIKISLYIAIISSITLGIGNLIFRYLVFNLDIRAFALIILISFCTSFLGVVMIQKAIKEIGSSSTAIFSLFEPITSILAGAIFLNERITIFKIIGCIFIFGAILYLIIGEKNKSED